jgi:predicted Zn-dependent peptidase
MTAAASSRTTLESLVPVFETLPNGLRIVAVPLPSAHRVATMAMLRVGSRYETVETNGVSHLLEHMLYRGIPGYPTAHEQALAFETLGGTLVAATGAESGTIAISCPPESFEATLALFSRVYTEPLLDGIDVERGIIREEILEDLDEDGRLVDDYALLRSTAFPGHPLGYPVVGSVRQIERLDVPDLRKHHERHYVGAGTVIAVAGPIDPDDVVRRVADAFGALPAGEVAQGSPPAPQVAPLVRFVPSSASQTALRVGFRGGGVRHPNEPATELVLRLLDDGNSTRLYTRLCDERGLAYDVGAGYDASDDVGLLDVSCGVAHTEAVTVFGEILDVVKRLRDDGPSAAELDKAKARHRWGLSDMLDDAGLCADYFADASLRGYARSLSERRASIDAVSREAVTATAAELFRAENLSAVIVGRPAKRAQVAIARLVSGFR